MWMRKDDDTEESEKPIFKDIDSSKETILDINVVDSDKEKEIEVPKVDEGEVKDKVIEMKDSDESTKSEENVESEDSSIDDDRELFRKKDVDESESVPEKDGRMMILRSLKSQFLRILILQKRQF
jgi:hypothetical protein